MAKPEACFTNFPTCTEEMKNKKVQTPLKFHYFVAIADGILDERIREAKNLHLCHHYTRVDFIIKYINFTAIL